MGSADRSEPKALQRRGPSGREREVDERSIRPPELNHRILLQRPRYFGH